MRNLSGDGDERAQDIDINALWEKTKKILVDTEMLLVLIRNYKV